MYKEALRSLENIDLFPVIALILFFTFFTLLIVRVLNIDTKTCTKFASVPLTDELQNKAE